REERRQENARLEEERRQERERQAELEALRIERLQRERLPRLSKPLAEVTIPAAKFEVGSLVVNRKKEEGLTWAMLPLDGPVDDRPDPLRGLVGSSNYVGVCWAADGQSFFVLSRNGVLRRIGYPGLMVMAEVKFNQ